MGRIWNSWGICSGARGRLELVRKERQERGERHGPYKQTALGLSPSWAVTVSATLTTFLSLSVLQCPHL